ncbi:Protein BTG3, partial [Zootermopsis nevadensis]
MLDEISAAVIFLARLIERSENFNQEQLEDFKEHLSQLLVERFENHWFPDQPCKGQGYRCIRVNERDPRDATLERAAIACGFRYEDLKLPVELTIWVDPNEVCCRFGEHRGSYCTLASFCDKENITTINKKLEKFGTIESKLQTTPLNTSNQHQANGKKGHGGGSPKQNKSGSRPNKNWGGHNGSLGFPHSLQSWYSLIPHQWLPPSPPPY